MTSQTNTDNTTVLNVLEGKLSGVSPTSGKEEDRGCVPLLSSILPDITHSATLLVLGILSWGTLYFMFGKAFAYDGKLFVLVVAPALGLTVGRILEQVTGLPPLLGSLAIGILLRNLHVLDITQFPDLDMGLRKFYPVLILGKSSLGWDYDYMKGNVWRVFSFGAIPWTVEVATVAVFTKYSLNFPWPWGFLLGTIYASLSGAVIAAPVLKIKAQGLGRDQKLTEIVLMGGGVDTALSVGVFGLLHSAMFYDSGNVYKVVKAALAIFVGIAIGVFWGFVARYLPSKEDAYVTELRILMVLIGGIFLSHATGALGWGGVGGVAVLLCNFTAAAGWTRAGWQLNKNAAATAYRVLWTTFEPILFTFTGNHLLFTQVHREVLIMGAALLAICLTTRLWSVFLVGWSFGLTVKERLFICCAWIPKSIVKAVLVPTVVAAVQDASSDHTRALAMIHLIIQLIVITTPLGYLLTTYAGPRLLQKL